MLVELRCVNIETFVNAKWFAIWMSMRCMTLTDIFVWASFFKTPQAASINRYRSFKQRNNTSNQTALWQLPRVPGDKISVKDSLRCAIFILKGVEIFYDRQPIVCSRVEMTFQFYLFSVENWTDQTSSWDMKLSLELHDIDDWCDAQGVLERGYLCVLFLYIALLAKKQLHSSTVSTLSPGDVDCCISEYSTLLAGILKNHDTQR